MGNDAEDVACTFLLNKGWIILDRNFYSGHSEIDIIAKDGTVIVFLEVKMRSNTKFGNPFEYVTEAKVEHIFKAAEDWALQHNALKVPMRFDVIGIVAKQGEKPIINHILDAYR